MAKTQVCKALMDTRIATAAEEQSSIAEEINRNVVTINEIAIETRMGHNKIRSPAT